MSHFVSNQRSPLFSSGQIVALDQPNGILYGEIIQTIPQRQMCWVRSIALALQTQEFIASVDQNSQDTLTELLSVARENQEEQNCISSNNSDIFHDGTVLIDLYRNVDLLFPLDLFRAAFDTEILPLLSSINHDPYNSYDDSQSSRKYLNWFLKEIWQSNQDKFKV